MSFFVQLYFLFYYWLETSVLFENFNLPDINLAKWFEWSSSEIPPLLTTAIKHYTLAIELKSQQIMSISQFDSSAIPSHQNFIWENESIKSAQTTKNMKSVVALAYLVGKYLKLWTYISTNGAHCELVSMFREKLIWISLIKRKLTSSSCSLQKYENQLPVHAKDIYCPIIRAYPMIWDKIWILFRRLCYLEYLENIEFRRNIQSDLFW